MNGDTTLDDDVDVFVHFDTKSSDLDGDGNLRITLPIEGWYWVSINNLRLAFPPKFVADTFIGYIGIVGTNIPVSSITTMVGSNKIAKMLFPLDNPASTTPKISSYNKIQLQSQDQLQLVYYDNTMKIIAVDRLVGTIHISSNPDVIRLTL